MDNVVAEVPETKDPEQDLRNLIEKIVPIGKKYGLTRNQSIAFFIRTTFSSFEPEEFRD